MNTQFPPIPESLVITTPSPFTREAMLSLLDDGDYHPTIAMVASITKWETIVYCLEQGNLKEALESEQGSRNCGLCHIYIYRQPYRRPCKGCPISIAGYNSCESTPFEDFVDEQTNVINGYDIDELTFEPDYTYESYIEELIEDGYSADDVALWESTRQQFINNLLSIARQEVEFLQDIYNHQDKEES